MAIDQNDLVRKQVALGVIREIPQPTNFIQSTLCPFMPVPSDDVIFQYVIPDSSGLAPARAEDAESEMAMKDDTIGTGRASILDWAIKDHYDTSDVTRHREYLRVAEAIGTGSFPLTIGSMMEDWPNKVARDTALRKRKLDNRLEWLAVKGAWDGVITYDDGKIKFSVDYARPGGQTAQAPTGGVWSSANKAAADPIGAILDMQTVMRDTYGIEMAVGYASPKVLRAIVNSDKFTALSGLAVASGGTPLDPRYLIEGWGATAAQTVVERQTGIKLLPYDGKYWTRALGATTRTLNRFADERDILFLPDPALISEISDIGFGKMMTSPHAEGNFTSGFYEWVTPEKQDPWGFDQGNGIKAFPVYPHLELSYTMRVLT